MNVALLTCVIMVETTEASTLNLIVDCSLYTFLSPYSMTLSIWLFHQKVFVTLYHCVTTSYMQDWHDILHPSVESVLICAAASVEPIKRQFTQLTDGWSFNISVRGFCELRIHEEKKNEKPIQQCIPMR